MTGASPRVLLVSTITPNGATIRPGDEGREMAKATVNAKKGNAAQTEAISYDDLYRRWEEGNWKATDIDFSEDRRGWERLSEIQRKSALWTYSMFFYGEDSVTENLSPYIDAAPSEEQ